MIKKLIVTNGSKKYVYKVGVNNVEKIIAIIINEHIDGYEIHKKNNKIISIAGNNSYFAYFDKEVAKND